MKIYINGSAFELPNTSEQNSIEMVLTKTLPKKQQQQSFALALNGDFVGRDEYQNTFVSDKDSIGVLFPIVGG